MKHAIITSTGSDRPGIVESLARWIFEQGGNMEESRMSLLGGEFAAMILVTGPDDLIAKLEETRAAIEQTEQLGVMVKEVNAAPAVPNKPVIRYRLNATSLDHSGIVHRITRFLMERGINIVSAKTWNTAAPFTGAPVFHFEMNIDLPSSLVMNEFRAELMEACRIDNIDYELTAVK